MNQFLNLPKRINNLDSITNQGYFDYTRRIAIVKKTMKTNYITIIDYSRNIILTSEDTVKKKCQGRGL